jgi:hypothetical protein
MAKSRGVISYKLRKYMQGILFLALAGFIMGSVSYLVGLIPESTIDLSGGSPTNPYLVERFNVEVSNNNPVVYKWFSYTPIHTFYVAVDASGLSPRTYARAIRIYFSNGDILYLAMYRYNDVVSYLPVDLNGRTIQAMQIEFNDSSSGIAVVSFYDTNNINDALAWSPPPTAPTISNKLILSFISWIAGIVLAIQGLQKFDIQI